MPISFPPSEPPASEAPATSAPKTPRPAKEQSADADNAVAISKPKTWVQSGLAIATGYLFLTTGVIAIMGLIALQGIEEFPPNLLLILTLAQLCLTTTGSYITALLAPSKDSLQPTQSLITHGLGLTALVFLLWLISALTSNGQEPWSIHILNLATALIGISAGTWLRSRQIQPAS